MTALDLVVYTLALAGLAPTMLGVLTMVFWFKASAAPADGSNRINRIRLWWFVLTRPELFVGTFPWLTNDEYDNVQDVKAGTPD